MRLLVHKTQMKMGGIKVPRLFCEALYFAGEGEDPPYMVVMACEGESEENPVHGTEEYHIFYTPLQVRQFLDDNETRLEAEGRADIEDYLDELSDNTWIDYPALHTSGHHAVALTTLAMMASETIMADDEVEPDEEDDKPRRVNPN